MPNALDAFKAQREAAAAVHAELSEVSSLIRQLRAQVDGLVPELKALIRDQQQWLAKTQEAVLEVRRWREREEPRFLRGVLLAVDRGHGIRAGCRRPRRRGLCLDHQALGC